MAKSAKPKKEKSESVVIEPEKHISELGIKSNTTGGKIIEGDAKDPNIDDGQAWREGREVTGN